MGIWMEFDDFIRRNDVRKVEKNKRLAGDLVATAKKDMMFLDSLDINKNSARKIFSGYYDVLRSVLEAIAILNGYKIYLHEAFSYFLKKIGKEKIGFKFDRFRRKRNRINYYGEEIDVDEARQEVNEMKELVNLLIKEYFEENKKWQK